MLMHQTYSAEDEKVEQFNVDIERTIADSDSKYKITTGDFMQILELKEKKTSKALSI